MGLRAWGVLWRVLRKRFVRAAGEHAKMAEMDTLYGSAAAVYKTEVIGGTALAALGNAMARFHKDKAQYKQALPLQKRALEIREAELGPTHPSTASSLWNLACQHIELQQWEEAETYLLRLNELGSRLPYQLPQAQVQQLLQYVQMQQA